jgi:FAD/FMN-containing dehydrogenase
MPAGARSCGHPSKPEETVERPEVITKQELQNPPAEQSGGMQRGQAIAHDGV